MTLNAVERNPSQSQLPMIGGVVRGGLRMHPLHDVRACEDDMHVFDRMTRSDPVRGRTEGFYADHLGIDRGLFSRMKNGHNRFALTEAQWANLEMLTGSLLYRQWIAYRRGFDLTPHKETPEEELERLRAELAQRST